MITKFELRSLVYHETVPGHHFQVVYEMENKALPRFRQIRAFGGRSALGKGWRLYAEHLAAESSWYEGDIEGHIGELHSERCKRLKERVEPFWPTSGSVQRVARYPSRIDRQKIEFSELAAPSSGDDPQNPTLQPDRGSLVLERFRPLSTSTKVTPQFNKNPLHSRFSWRIISPQYER
jgi:hypothetical protein